MSGRTRKRLRGEASGDPIANLLRRVQATRSVTKDEILCIFRVDKPHCQGCRSNNKESPHCLCGLVPNSNSTRKHGLWQKLSDSVDSLGADPTKEHRTTLDFPSGLTNLGATCYVNSILQCLYMNTAFRDGFFAAEAELVRNHPALHQLARLFGQLHSGQRMSVDSAEFVLTLELDNAIQQDGQEFLKLLLTMLERILAQSRVPEAREVVQNVFRGTFSYVTKCSCCGKESDASNQFVDFYELELNVKGFATLEESLEDYLSEDKLEGENQYFCEYCKARVDATRCSKLRSLPPVLNFQLKRFVFNTKTATKKKVTSKFSFPKVLDMASRVSPIDTVTDSYIYDLSAILLHKGNMASSGHYVAHIKDERSGDWWQFDDDQVECLLSQPLGVQASKKDPEDSEDLLVSADAYMLMYSRRSLDTSDLGPDNSKKQRDQSLLPEHIRLDVEQLNADFFRSCEEYTRGKEEHCKRIAERKEEVRQILAKAPVESTASKICWILTEWLRTWADSLTPHGPIDNSPLLCEHKGVSHKQVHMMKCISETAWTDLHSKYGGGPELTLDSCCMECIFSEADAAATADSYRSDRTAMKIVAENAMAGEGLEGQLYYVSKTWLTQWMRRKVFDKLTDADADPTAAITCPHGGLQPEQASGAKRQSVPEVLWLYFYHKALEAGGNESGHKPFPLETETCAICEVNVTQTVCKQKDLRATKIEERQNLDAVYSGKTVILLPDTIYYLVPSPWIAKWRSYLGASGKNVLNHEEPFGLEQSIASVLCEKHKKLLHRPPQLSRTKRGEIIQKASADVKFVLVSESDWLFFCQRWDVEAERGIKATLEPEVLFTTTNGNSVQDEASEVKLPILRTEPEVCEECIGDRESRELIKKLSFKDETITVELVQGKEPPPSLLASPHVPDAERRTSKRSRRAVASGNQRISLVVSGTTSVYQLKLLIWQSLGIIKENQKVHYKRKELADESATLADMEILPGSQLWVVDTGVHEYRDIAEELPLQREGKAEEGFRGTRLLDSGFSVEPTAATEAACKGGSSPSEEQMS